MGKSRSATIVIAYLLWKSHRGDPATSVPNTPNTGPDISRDVYTPSNQRLTPEAALGMLRQGRPLAEPNDGFMDQLRLYHSMGCPDSIDSHPQYQRWLYQKTVRESLRDSRAPDIGLVRFEDEHKDEHEGEIKATSDTSDTDETRELSLRCRRCRRLLARSNFLADHEAAVGDGVGDGADAAAGPNRCAHHFLHPLSWMKSNLEGGQLQGRLSCPNPKCGANVGKFAWQGMRCNCGRWITPAFALAKGRVDQQPMTRSPAPGTFAPSASTIQET